MKTNKPIMPVLYSLPHVNAFELPARAELLPKIESGEIDHLDFQARVFSPHAVNLNPYRFKLEDMETFAKSFEGQPYLRDHNTYSIDARDGTLIDSSYDGEWINQQVHLTTRRGMLDYIEGKMDRFSIGWFYDDAQCSICDDSFFGRDCEHFPGMKYKVGEEMQTCVLTFVNPKGKETSAVVVPAVQGTGITGQLAEFKLSLMTDRAIETSDGQAPVDEMQTPKLAQERGQLVDAKANAPLGDAIMNVRELLKERDELMTRATQLAELADSESRDFTDDERTEFQTILGAGEDKGRIGALDAQINQINEERERLKAALSVKLTDPTPEKPEPASNAGDKLIKRAEFDQLSATEKAAFLKRGGTIE